MVNSNPGQMRKTMVSDAPWTSLRSSSSAEAMPSLDIELIVPRFPQGSAPTLRMPQRMPSDTLAGERPRGKVRSGIKSLIANTIVSPSFLFSSLLVFLFVPDAILKGRYSIDLRSRASEAFRRSMDIVGASILLMLTSPLLVLIPILIKLDSPGSVIYRQVRVGVNRRNGDRRKSSYRLKGDRRNGDRRQVNHHGKLFMVYKFRSMREDAEKKSGPVWARQGDPRITKAGKLLRSIRADEIPQLINIVKGDMSLVGPRPERPYFVNQFVASINRYEERLSVKPGLTGYAQVMGGYDTCLEDVHAKLENDLAYIAHRSIGEDMKILLRTIGVVLTRKGVYD